MKTTQKTTKTSEIRRLYDLLKPGKNISGTTLRKVHGFKNPSATVFKLRDKLFEQDSALTVHTNRTGYRLGFQYGAQQEIQAVWDKIQDSLNPKI